VRVVTAFCDICGKQFKEDEMESRVVLAGYPNVDSNSGHRVEDPEVCRACIAKLFEFYFSIKQTK